MIADTPQARIAELFGPLEATAAAQRRTDKMPRLQCRTKAEAMRVQAWLIASGFGWNSRAGSNGIHSEIALDPGNRHQPTK